MVGLSIDGATSVMVEGNTFNQNQFEGMGIGSPITNLTVQFNRFTGNTTGLSNYAATSANAERTSGAT